MNTKVLLLIFLSIFISCDKDPKVPDVPPSEPAPFELNKLYINTENSASVDSKENYVVGTVEIADKNEPENLTHNIKIRGRGNSTWSFFPKKSYQINLMKKRNY